MRYAKKVLFFTATLVMLAGGWLVFECLNPPILAPAGSIRLLSYSNVTYSSNDISIGSWIRAQMLLTNEGSVSLSYAAYRYVPYGWAKVQTDLASTNGYLAPPYTGGRVVLQPGCTAEFRVLLPTNSLQWQCGFDIETASMKDRVVCGLFGNKFIRSLPFFCFYPIEYLPEKAGPRIGLSSPLFKITNMTAKTIIPATN